MNARIFKLFYDGLPDDAQSVMPVYDKCRLVTFLNPYYMVTLRESDYHLYEEFDHICSDGIGPIKMNEWFGKPKSERISFDMSGRNGNDGLAGRVFADCVRTGNGVYVLGAHQEAVDGFIGVLKSNYKGIIISGYHNGYISDCYDTVLDEVVASGAHVAVIGMGAPLQERVSIDLKKRGFVGTVYTCGGFIHQTAQRMNYYPKWVDRYNLRAFYRILHEKGMVSRLLRTYPVFIIRYSLFLLSRK